MNLEELQSLAKEIRAVYEAISKKIEELIFFLNEAKEGKEEIQLAERIDIFLRGLQKSLREEKKSSRRISWPKEKKRKFLGLIEKELKDIKKLEAFVKLAKKKPRPEVITKIHELYQQVKKEMAAEQALLEN